MTIEKISGTTVDVAGKPFVFIHGHKVDDPYANWASRKLFEDFDRLGMSRKASEGLVAFAETYATYEFGGEEVSVSVESDPGEITITSARRKLIDSLLEKLQELGGYDIERRI